MPTYIYETTDPSKPIRRFEVQQSMKDEALRSDPKTGEPVRRVISGGLRGSCSGRIHGAIDRFRRLARVGLQLLLAS